MSQENPPSSSWDDSSRARPLPPQWSSAPPAPGYPPYPPVRPTNTFAILALVFSIIVSPLGIIFGVLASRQIKVTGEQGEGLAKAGFIVGIVITSMWALYFVFLFMFFAIPLLSIALSNP